jgi:malate/lactate dehydrogenase
VLVQQLKLGKNGIEEYLPLGELSAYEQKALDEAVTILQVP